MGMTLGIVILLARSIEWEQCRHRDVKRNKWVCPRANGLRLVRVCWSVGSYGVQEVDGRNSVL
jgi:hypothetical protein